MANKNLKREKIQKKISLKYFSNKSEATINFLKKKYNEFWDKHDMLLRIILILWFGYIIYVVCRTGYIIYCKSIGEETIAVIIRKTKIITGKHASQNYEYTFRVGKESYNGYMYYDEKYSIGDTIKIKYAKNNPSWNKKIDD